MQLAHRQGLDEGLIILPVLSRLTPYADHAIDTDESVRHDGLYMVHPLGEELPRVTSSHDLQHLVTAALQGNVKMRREMLAGGYKIDDLVGKQVRFAATDSYPESRLLTPDSRLLTPI